METELIDPSTLKNVTNRQQIRLMSECEWIDVHGSGTLRKNKRLGFVYRPQYLHERVCWEFGNVFEILPRSRVTFGDAISEGDCKSITEAGWFIDRYITHNKSIFPEDYYECKYIYASRPDQDSEGIGIVVRSTCAPWIPSGHILFGIISEFSKISGTFKAAQNPM